ncbi:MAG TPA: TraR/DksA C4-type zinc finger protein [Streptosporangiaceae bacterium]|jgi:RNA polymerase-binding transcription factor DksA|nr:TraR/DksA C4-type zinc finger protein [Streptosporangiaceae bacterium]
MTNREPGDGAAPTRREAAEDALRAERLESLARLEALTREFDGIVASSDGVATDDEHDPEGATIAFERARTAGLIESTRQRLADLDEALARIGEGSYGICQRCGQPIAPGRLAARPAARTCINCASALACLAG